MKHDLFKMKRVAQAVTLAVLLSAPAAHAVVIDWGVHDALEVSQRQVANSGGLKFIDFYDFVLPENNDLSSVAASNNLVGSTLITQGRVGLWSGTSADFNANEATWVDAFNSYGYDGGSGNTQHVFSNLAGGNYFYLVSGIAGGEEANLGMYSLTSSLSPVAPIPEPEIYAMMAAGLGLMGFIGRRRSRREK